MCVWQTPAVTVWLCSFTRGGSVAVCGCVPCLCHCTFYMDHLRQQEGHGVLGQGGSFSLKDGWLYKVLWVPTRYHPLSITVVARSMANVTHCWMTVGKTKEGSSIPFNLKTTSMWSSVFVFCDETCHTVCKQRTQGRIKLWKLVIHYAFSLPLRWKHKT